MVGPEEQVKVSESASHGMQRTKQQFHDDGRTYSGARSSWRRLKQHDCGKAHLQPESARKVVVAYGLSWRSSNYHLDIEGPISHLPACSKHPITCITSHTSQYP